MPFFKNPFATEPQQQAPAPVNPTATPGNMPESTPAPSNNTPGAEPNGVVPGQASNQQQTKDDSPLAQYQDLWQTSKQDEGQQSLDSSSSQQLNAEDVQKIMAKQDFSAGLDQETLSAIAAGGEGAQNAFAKALNSVAQQVMVQSTMVNNKLTEKAVKEAIDAHNSKLPELLRSQSVSNHLKETNPLFSNPAVSPVIEATKQQLLAKFPDATNEQITEMAQNYVVEMGKAFSPQETVNNNGPEEVNWDKFLNS